MRIHQIACLLAAVACCLVGRLGWAQRTDIAPLAPLPPVVRPTPPKGLLEGVQSGIQPARQAPVSTAVAPVESRVWPIMLLNSRIIISGSGLGAINPQDIADIHVYKGADVPVQWRSLTEHGLLTITLKPALKPKLRTKSLNAIRRQAKARGLVSFQVNGLRLDDASLRIATDAIAGLDVQRDDIETVINIRLTPPKPTPPALLSTPGTIWIRGTASR